MAGIRIGGRDLLKASHAEIISSRCSLCLQHDALRPRRSLLFMIDQTHRLNARLQESEPRSSSVARVEVETFVTLDELEHVQLNVLYELKKKVCDVVERADEVRAGRTRCGGARRIFIIIIIIIFRAFRA